MSNSILIRIAYYFGVFLGIFTFSYNSRENRFVLSKKLQIYNNIVLALSLVLLIVIFFLHKPSVRSHNLVIEIATPLNFFLLLAVVWNTYFISKFKGQEIVDLLNCALDIERLVTNESERFKLRIKVFLRTFAIDALFFCYICMLVYRTLYVHVLGASFVSMTFFLNASKNICRFMTHIYICGMLFNLHLLSNIEIKAKDSIRKFESFLRVNSQISKYQWVKKCCKLSDELDYCAVQGAKILLLIYKVHALFNRHLLILITFTLTDILLNVRFNLFSNSSP